MYLRGNLTKMFSRTSFGRWLRVLCSIHAELEPQTLPGFSPTRFIVISLRPAHKHTKDWGRKRNFQIPQYFLNILPMTT